MSAFYDSLCELEEHKKGSAKVFQAIAMRLLQYGKIIASDSEVECDLYDAALALKAELEDYFACAGMRLVNNRDRSCLTLYPPQPQSPEAKRPQDQDVADDTDTLLRRRVTPNTSAALLALRLLYTQEINEGHLNNEGEVAVSVDDLYTTMRTSINYAPTASVPERRRTLRELERFFRVIRIPKGADLDENSMMIHIRPYITDLLSESVIEDALAGATGDVPEEDEHEPA